MPLTVLPRYVSVCDRDIIYQEWLRIGVSLIIQILIIDKRYNEVEKKTQYAGPATLKGPGGAWLPPLFCVAKRKTGNKGKQERL